LRVDPRTVRKYIKQGKLVAKAQGVGVKKTYLVSVDSLHELLGSGLDPRMGREDVPQESARSATTADLVELVRDLSEEVTRRASEATELRTRLELTERAESSQREALEQRLETERLRRDQAEQERDELRRRLESIQEMRDALVTGAEPVEDTDTPPHQDGPETVVQRRSSWWRRWFGFHDRGSG
jgi:predicted RNase H-like nuclease (RuvC/YqgF family)